MELGRLNNQRRNKSRIRVRIVEAVFSRFKHFSERLQTVQITGGIFFSQGSSTPDSGARTHSAVQGSRGTAYNDNFSDRFNIGQIYGSKEFKTNSISINIDGGKMNLDTPFNDKALDLGTGGRINMKQKVNRGEVGYHLSFFI